MEVAYRCVTQRQRKKERQIDREPQRQLDSCPLRDFFFPLWASFKFFSFLPILLLPPTHTPLFFSIRSNVLSVGIICLPALVLPPHFSLSDTLHFFRGLLRNKTIIFRFSCWVFLFSSLISTHLRATLPGGLPR